MAKTGRASGAAEKKAAVVRKQQEKVAARRRIKEEKIKKKNEKVFAKSLQNYSKGSNERARAFVDQALDDNPGWIRGLADLIRDGALQALLKGVRSEQGGPEAHVVERWSGKAKTWGELPSDAKVRMLESVGVGIPQEGVAEQTLDVFFSVQFFVDHDVPLPANCRSFEVLEQLAKERFRSLGSSALASECKEIKPCYALADGELCCHFSEELATLPSLEGDDVWVLSDECVPSATVYSKAKPLVSFACRTLFDATRKIDPRAKWTLAKKDQNK